VLGALEQMQGGEAETLWRLLWSYSPRQLEGGADAELVALLDHPQLAVRVLASESLREITGTSLSYRATDSAVRRAPLIKRWETKLRKNEIRWTP
jgi:hypothetical protein